VSAANRSILQDRAKPETRQSSTNLDMSLSIKQWGQSSRRGSHVESQVEENASEQALSNVTSSAARTERASTALGDSPTTDAEGKRERRSRHGGMDVELSLTKVNLKPTLDSIDPANSSNTSSGKPSPSTASGAPDAEVKKARRSGHASLREPSAKEALKPTTEFSNTTSSLGANGDASSASIATMRRSEHASLGLKEPSTTEPTNATSSPSASHNTSSISTDAHTPSAEIGDGRRSANSTFETVSPSLEEATRPTPEPTSADATAELSRPASTTSSISHAIVGQSINVSAEPGKIDSMTMTVRKPQRMKDTERTIEQTITDAPMVALRAAQRVITERSFDGPASPSLFCWVFIITKSAEPSLMRVHLDRGVGIFGCKRHIVFADDDLYLSTPSGAVSEVVPLPGQPAWHGPVPGSTALVWHNTDVFARAWNWIHQAGPHLTHDWTVKVDPDTVFLPGRLQRQLLDRYKPSGVFQSYDTWKYLDPKVPMYLVNCRQWYSLQGPLEIFSQGAAEKFFAGIEACKSSLEWQGWGEDWFVEHCMDFLGVQKREGFGLLADMYCTSDYDGSGKSYMQAYLENGPTCADGRAAYHAYKTVQNLTMCLDQALDSSHIFRAQQ